MQHGSNEIDLDLDLVDVVVIGREGDCQIVLTDRLVSRHHGRLTMNDDGLTIEDLDSRNGVFVNQRRIRKAALLTHGDVIGIGLQSLEVIDLRVVRRKEKPTLPIPYGTSDVAGPEPATYTARLHVLSEREREVFELIVLGHTQREVAEQLFVSVKTVETHRAHIAEKLRCRTRAQLVAYAITAGVLRLGT